MPPDATSGRRRRVVVIGGGFGGLAAARKLRRRRRGRDPRRPEQPSPVPAAPLSGRGGRAVAERLRVPDPALPQAQQQHHGPDGRGHRGRPRATAGGPRPRRPPRLRQPDRRLRRGDLLLRQRPVEAGDVRSEDARRRRRSAQPLLRRPRAGRAHGRSGRAARVDDVRRRRRRSHRCRDRRRARDHGAHHETRLPADRLFGGTGDPARRRRAGGRRLQPQALQARSPTTSPTWA